MQTVSEFFEGLRAGDLSVKYVIHYEKDGSHYRGHGYKEGTAEEIAKELEEEYPGWTKIRVEGSETNHVMKR